MEISAISGNYLAKSGNFLPPSLAVGFLWKRLTTITTVRRESARRKGKIRIAQSVKNKCCSAALLQFINP